MGRVSPKQLEASKRYDYKNKRVDAAKALEILNSKSLADGSFYYIGLNKKDGWIEVFKSNTPAPDNILSVEEIDKMLAERNLYILAEKGGFVTIRRIPPNADTLSDVRAADKE